MQPGMPPRGRGLAQSAVVLSRGPTSSQATHASWIGWLTPSRGWGGASLLVYLFSASR